VTTQLQLINIIIIIIIISAITTVTDKIHFNNIVTTVTILLKMNLLQDILLKIL